MKVALVTDAWKPQVNGVVTTLVELHEGLLARGHEVVLIEPSAFRRFACPGYREIELAWRPGRQVAKGLEAADADAIHIATEGPLGSAARARISGKRVWKAVVKRRLCFRHQARAAEPSGPSVAMWIASASAASSSAATWRPGRQASSISR